MATCLSQCLVRVEPVIQFHLAECPNIVMALHLSGRAHTLLGVTSQLLIGTRLGYRNFFRISLVLRRVSCLINEFEGFFYRSKELIVWIMSCCRLGGY